MLQKLICSSNSLPCTIRAFSLRVVPLAGANLGRIVRTKMGNGQDVSFYMPKWAYASPSSSVQLPANPGLDSVAGENPRLTVAVPNFAGSFYYDPLSTVTGVAIPKSMQSPMHSPQPSPNPSPTHTPSPAVATKPAAPSVNLMPGNSPSPMQAAKGSSTSFARLPFSLLALLACAAVVTTSLF